MALRGVGIIGRGDRPLLGTERLRGVELDLPERLRLDTTGGGQRIAYLDSVDRGSQDGQRLGSHVAGRPAAEPVAGDEGGARSGAAAEHTVAEPEMSAAVVLHLDNEVGGEAVAAQ